MLQQQRIFGLSQIAAVSRSSSSQRPDVERDKEDVVVIVDWAVTGDSGTLVFVTSDPAAAAIHSVRGTDVAAFTWFSSPDLRPRCLAFNAEEDFLLVSTANSALYIVPATAVVPGHRAKGNN